jgi:hypothetical protein
MIDQGRAVLTASLAPSCSHVVRLDLDQGQVANDLTFIFGDDN